MLNLVERSRLHGHNHVIASVAKGDDNLSLAGVIFFYFLIIYWYLFLHPGNMSSTGTYAQAAQYNLQHILATPTVPPTFSLNVIIS